MAMLFCFQAMHFFPHHVLLVWFTLWE